MASHCHRVSYSFSHSVVCLGADSQPLPKRVLHAARSSASSFNILCLLVSLRSSSSCLRLLSRHPITSILPSSFPSIACFRRQFLRKMWPIQLAFLPFPVRRIFLFPWPFVTLLHFSQELSNIFSPTFSSTIFQNFPGVSHLLSELLEFKHHKKLWSKCSTLHVIR